MFTIPHIDEHGFGEPWPAGRFYAALLAAYAGYLGGQREEAWWRWRGQAATTRRYEPGVFGTPVEARLYEPQRMMSLYLMEPTSQGIAVRMLGDPWDDDTLFALIATLRPHPYGHLVAGAIIDQADWLDEHPAYRGLPVKNATHLHPDALEVTP